MTDSSLYVETLSDLVRQQRPFVTVTMIDAVGSTPQDVGAKMIVDQDGLVVGTVGGGRVERKAIDVAIQLLTEPSTDSRSQLVRWNLQNDVGMTCGGVVQLFFEVYHHRRWSIVIFGAGHVAQAVVRTLLPLDCHITCIDSRQEWLARLPSSPRLVTRLEENPQDTIPSLDARSYVLCMTMGHRTDRPILQAIFQQRRQFAYLGVIGSQAKRKVLVRELREAGIDDTLSEQFECPIGLALGNNQPAEIAISVAAQLLQRRDAG